MPIVRIENAGTLTKEQKIDLIAQVTQVVAQVTKKPQDYVLVKIEEIPRENMGRGGVALG